MAILHRGSLCFINVTVWIFIRDPLIAYKGTPNSKCENKIKEVYTGVKNLKSIYNCFTMFPFPKHFEELLYFQL